MGTSGKCGTRAGPPLGAILKSRVCWLGLHTNVPRSGGSPHTHATPRPARSNSLLRAVSQGVLALGALRTPPGFQLRSRGCGLTPTVHLLYRVPSLTKCHDRGKRNTDARGNPSPHHAWPRSLRHQLGHGHHLGPGVENRKQGNPHPFLVTLGAPHFQLLHLLNTRRPGLAFESSQETPGRKPAQGSSTLHTPRAAFPKSTGHCRMCGVRGLQPRSADRPGRGGGLPSRPEPEPGLTHFLLLSRSNPWPPSPQFICLPARDCARPCSGLRPSASARELLSSVKAGGDSGVVGHVPSEGCPPGPHPRAPSGRTSSQTCVFSPHQAATRRLTPVRQEGIRPSVFLFNARFLNEGWMSVCIFPNTCWLSGPPYVHSRFHLGPVLLWDCHLVPTGLCALDDSVSCGEPPRGSSDLFALPPAPIRAHKPPLQGRALSSLLQGGVIEYFCLGLAVSSSTAASGGPSSPAGPKEVPCFTLLQGKPVPAFSPRERA